jgi:hypothetical protein
MWKRFTHSSGRCGLGKVVGLVGHEFPAVRGPGDVSCGVPKRGGDGGVPSQAQDLDHQDVGLAMTRGPSPWRAPGRVRAVGDAPNVVQLVLDAPAVAHVKGDLGGAGPGRGQAGASQDHDSTPLPARRVGGVASDQEFHGTRETS